MTPPLKNNIILFEKDDPVSIDLLNHSAGIWFTRLTPGVITITDDYGVVGYYENNNEIIYNVKSLKINGEKYFPVTSFADLKTQEKSYYYDASTTDIYIRFDNYDPPEVFEFQFVGAAGGFSYGATENYFLNYYYEPRITGVFNIKKSKDPLFFGLLKFISGNVKMINEDGYFDNWKDEKNFNKDCRLLIGQEGDAYADFYQYWSGFIENDSQDWSEFSVKVQDIRKSLSNPICQNRYNLTDYPYLNEDNVDEPVPVAYGAQINAPCICINETESGASVYTFKCCDTEFNNLTSVSTVYVDGVSKTFSNVSTANGTFTITSSDLGGNFDNVTANFTGANITNGVDIIKNLMLNYAETSYLSAFWDTTETAAAQSIARSTTLYVEDQDFKTSEGIESVCKDIDGLFFAKDNGLFTIRIYDEDRTPVKTILSDEWLNGPAIENNESEFLSSVTIGYKRDIDNDKYLLYENTDYKKEVFASHWSYQTKTIETNLSTLSDAQEKSETIMNISKDIQSIIKRDTTTNHFDLEIMDFIIASPTSRVNEPDNWGIYEIIGIQKNAIDNKTTLTMRYVKDYTMPEYEVNMLVDDSGNYLIDDSGNYLIDIQEV